MQIMMRIAFSDIQSPAPRLMLRALPRRLLSAPCPSSSLLLPATR